VTEKEIDHDHADLDGIEAQDHSISDMSRPPLLFLPPFPTPRPHQLTRVLPTTCPSPDTHQVLPPYFMSCPEPTSGPVLPQKSSRFTLRLRRKSPASARTVRKDDKTTPSENNDHAERKEPTLRSVATCANAAPVEPNRDCSDPASQNFGPLIPDM
jgi:hypothetical protein